MSTAARYSRKIFPRKGEQPRKRVFVDHLISNPTQPHRRSIVRAAEQLAQQHAAAEQLAKSFHYQVVHGGSGAAQGGGGAAEGPVVALSADGRKATFDILEGRLQVLVNECAHNIQTNLKDIDGSFTWIGAGSYNEVFFLNRAAIQEAADTGNKHTAPFLKFFDNISNEMAASVILREMYPKRGAFFGDTSKDLFDKSDIANVRLTTLRAYLRSNQEHPLHTLVPFFTCYTKGPKPEPTFDMRPVMLMEKLESAYDYYSGNNYAAILNVPSLSLEDAAEYSAVKINALITFLATIRNPEMSGVQCEDMKANNLAVCTTGSVPVLKIIDLEQIVVPRFETDAYVGRLLPGHGGGVSTYRPINGQCGFMSINAILRKRFLRRTAAGRTLQITRPAAVAEEEKLNKCTKQAVDYERIFLAVIAVFDLLKQWLGQVLVHEEAKLCFTDFLTTLNNLKQNVATTKWSRIDYVSRRDALYAVYDNFADFFKSIKLGETLIAKQLLTELAGSIFQTDDIADKICETLRIDRKTFAQFAHPPPGV